MAIQLTYRKTSRLTIRIVKNGDVHVSAPIGMPKKELDLTEGRATGIPTIQEEMQTNGSPRATIETNDERSFINVFIPVHEGCGDKVIQVTGRLTKRINEQNTNRTI